jgi:hypothetical protein
MSIEHITGMGAISAYSEENSQRDHQDESRSEAFILEFLTGRYGLAHTQAVAILGAVLACGSNLTQLADGLQNNDAAVIALFEAYIL